MQIPLFHVDAFTSQPFSGNPAAVCLPDSWLDDGDLRKVAAENNISATAFLLARNQAFELRWFTPRCEVKLCGHATLAAAYLLFNVLQPDLDEVQFTTRFSGILTVRKQANALAMDFPAFSPKNCPDARTEVLHALGLEQASCTLLEANHIYLAVFETADAIKAINPDFALLERFHPYAVVATAPGDGEEADFVSRYFAPSYGIPEDPVTGSAHCLLTPYWSKRLHKLHLHARQLSERGGELWCELAGERVILKGQAVLTLQGTLTV